MIPLVRPLFPKFESIQKHFDPALASGQISNFGLCFDELTSRLRKRLGMHSLPVVNGTAAIQVAIQTIFKKGSHIALPDYTHIGTLQAVVAAHCVPVLMPVSSQTWTLDPKVLERNSTVDGAIVVSPFGYPVDVDMYDDLAKKKGIKLIYDFAGAWGLDPVTSHPVCYSMHATKNFSCGEGGITCFKYKSDYRRAKRLVNFDTLPDRQIASIYGSNLKPDELKCAIALAHMDDEGRIFERIQRKRAVMDFYIRELEINMNSRFYSLGYPSLVVIPMPRAAMIEKKCKTQGFMSKRYYPLLTRMECLRSVERVGTSSSYFEECLALPSDVSDAEAMVVVRAIKRLLKG